MGYNTCNLLQNLNTILVFLIGIAIASILAPIINKCLSKRPKYQLIFQPYYRSLFFSLTIRTFLESYIEITLSSTINLSNLSFGYGGDQISSILSVTLITIVFAMPPGILIFVFRTYKNVEDLKFKERFGSLYEGLRTERIIYQLSQFFFTARRLLLILVTVYLINYPAFQIMAFIILSELSLMYIVCYRPYETAGTNAIEIFNELCVIAVGYQLFIFTDYVTDPKMKSQGGYGLIAAILCNFGVNIVIQLIQMMKTMPKACFKFRKTSLMRKIASKFPKINLDPPVLGVVVDKETHADEHGWAVEKESETHPRENRGPIVKSNDIISEFLNDPRHYRPRAPTSLEINKVEHARPKLDLPQIGSYSSSNLLKLDLFKNTQLPNVSFNGQQQKDELMATGAVQKRVRNSLFADSDEVESQNWEETNQQLQLNFKQLEYEIENAPNVMKW